MINYKSVSLTTAASILLACKISETPRYLKDIVTAANYAEKLMDKLDEGRGDELIEIVD